MKKDDWSVKLSPEQYHVLREYGTEPPFTGALLNNKESGVYQCAGCGEPLFVSDAKFDSGSGWPSFWQPITKDAIKLTLDKSNGMIRTEASCAKCDGHLGHVFPDGPQPSGERYCMNSLSLEFKKSEV